MNYIQINENDNVFIALTDLPKGHSITLKDKTIHLKDDLKRGHKFAVVPIEKGENIIKYGSPIGHATNTIQVGEHVHTHNTKTNLDGLLTYTYEQRLVENPYQNENLTFKGYRRKNGDVGIRNELWIVPTVGCVNGVSETIINRFIHEVGDIHPFENVLVLKHNYGCSQLGDDHEHTKTILQNAVVHPNAGGVLVLGLGCENNTLAEFRNSLGEYDEERVKFLVAQEVDNEIEAGVKLLKEIYEVAQSDQREDVPLSKLKVGLKCGGSDGLSGITANPLLGKLSDYLVAQGGTTVLTEVPEMFGAETILMERAKDMHTFEK